MNARDIREYYSREEVQNALIEMGQDREVVGVFSNGSYDQRPNIIAYPQDVMAMVRGGVVEFHASLERWSNPMRLGKGNYSELRTGWDLVLDLDLDYKILEHGKIITNAFVWGLKKHGIRNFSLKFTGSTGFHILIPWEAFPEEVNYEKTLKKFPGLPRIMGRYLAFYVQERAEKDLFRKYSPEELAAQTNKPLGKILTTEGLNMREFLPYRKPHETPKHIMKSARVDYVGADPILISPRHLFRMPYSLHATTGFASLPLEPGEIDDFQKKDAEPRRVKVRPFLKKAEPGEAELLVTEALDWEAKIPKKVFISRERKSFESPVSEAYFPPCIKNIVAGLQDGRKRSLFILINSLRTMKWNWKSVEDYVNKWNQKNTPPLGDTYVRGQLRWHNKRKILPPNCLAQGWYMNMGICSPDSHCGGQKKTVKNPVNYAWRVMGRKPKSKIKKNRMTGYASKRTPRHA